MEFTNFVALVRDEVEKQVGDCHRVRLDNVTKNNGITLTGVTIMQDNSNLSPTIYLNNYYEEYINGRTTFSNVVSDVMNTYNRNKVNHCVDMRYFLNFNDVKSRIIYKLVNTERNKELLEDIPHIEFLDLSIVFQCLVSQEELGTASILIHNTHAKLWDVTTDMLHQVAKENTPKLLPYEIKSMAETLCDIIQAENPEGFNYDECMVQFKDRVPMYVLSNKNWIEGAVCMLYSDLLHDFADGIGSSFYIIPSSIHELLLLPTKNNDQCEEVKSMIREINNTQVSNEEILSYSLYFFDKETDNIVSL